jgi:hypothetical protein
MLSLSIVPLSDAVKYCVGDELHENVTVGDTPIHLELVECPYGCFDNITATGSACAEPDINIVSMSFFLIILFIFLIYSLPKIFSKKRGKR